MQTARGQSLQGASLNIFIIIVSVIEILVGIALIVFVLLHSGKGTGVSSMLGGVMSQRGRARAS